MNNEERFKKFDANCAVKLNGLERDVKANIFSEMEALIMPLNFEELADLLAHALDAPYSGPRKLDRLLR
jgi:hypothetical protein